MSACCDTSFLFSLYANDRHSRKALAWVRQFRQPISISMFNGYEFANALRLAAFRKLLPLQSASAYLADFEADIAAGKIIMVTVNLASVIAEARRLSATHTTQGGHRAFDILHVALALHAEATDFFSFDAKQRDLAKAVGLVVND